MMSIGMAFIYLFKPSPGTHLNVEKRQLNGVDRIYMEQVGGAMGWYLGDLEEDATSSITLAYMFGRHRNRQTFDIDQDHYRAE
jgi:hypothetical protein